LSAFAGMAKPVTAIVTPAVKEADTKPAVVKETPKTEVVKPTEKKPEPKPVVVKNEDKPAKEPEHTVIVKNDTPKEEPVTTKNSQVKETPKSKNFSGGYFKNIFADQVKGADISSETGTAAVFKSTSGWEDGKYYCLHNGAASGTIVKITSPATGRSVFAKVLDVMPDIKQNNGLVIRLSNAAAAELGQDESKFDCTLSFSK
ncbi:MAG: hypothetical protein V4685_16865, partial [Bacteroidota bacterium]